MSEDISEDRFVSAWRANPAARASFLASVRRELSKTGSLAGYEGVFGCLSRHLSKDEVFVLYQELQRCGRPESEWREEFLASFSTVGQSDLPKPIVDEEEAEQFAREARANQEQFGQSGTGYSEVPF